MLGELLERAGLELGVAHRLSDQLPPALGQAPQAAGVVPFPGRLLANGLADLGGVELLGRHRLELLVAGEQFQLPITDLRRLLPPAADLFVDPQGMIGRAHDDERRRRRTDPLPPGEKILHEGPHLDRLRRDAETCRRERPHRRERVGLRGPGGEDLFAAGSLLLAPHPLQPHLLDAEIVARLEREADRLRVEEHSLAPQPIDRDRRRLVVADHEAHREWLASGEAEPILPGKSELDRRLDEDLRRHDRRRFRSDVVAVDRGAGQLPVGRRRHRHSAPLHDRQASRAQPLRDRSVDAKVIREADQRRKRGDLRSERRLERDLLAGIPHRQPQARRAHLRGKGERIGLPLTRRRDLPPTADPGLCPGRSPRRGCIEMDDELGRLAMGDDDRLREPVDPRKRVALHEPPRREKPLPGVGRGGRHEQPEPASQHQRHGNKRQPEPMPRPGKGCPQVVAARHLGHLADRRLAQHPRARLLAGIANQLHDPEELIAERGEAASDEPRQPVEPACSPDPAMKRHRKGATGGDRGSPQSKAHKLGAVGDPIEEEEPEPSDEDAEEGSAERFDPLHPPDGGAEVVELLPQRHGEREGGRVPGNGRLWNGFLGFAAHALVPARESTLFILPFSLPGADAEGHRSLSPPPATRAPATCAPPRTARGARRAWRG